MLIALTNPAHTALLTWCIKPTSSICFPTHRTHSRRILRIYLLRTCSVSFDKQRMKKHVALQEIIGNNFVTGNLALEPQGPIADNRARWLDFCGEADASLTQSIAEYCWTSKRSSNADNWPPMTSTHLLLSWNWVAEIRTLFVSHEGPVSTQITLIKLHCEVGVLLEVRSIQGKVRASSSSINEARSVPFR